MVVEAIPAGVGAVCRMASQDLGEAAVEALDHAVGLGPVGPGELVSDVVALAGLVEGMGAGSLIALSPARVAEAVGELRAIVGQDGVDGVAEGLQEALQAGGDGWAAAVLDDLHIDEAGRALDGHEDVSRQAPQARQVLQIDMDIAEGLGLEALGGLPGVLRSARHAPALEAAMQGRSGDVGSQAAAHHLQGVIQGEPQTRAQLHGDLLLFKGEAGGEDVRCGGAIGDIATALPAPDRRLANAELARELGHRLRTGLDVGPHLRRRRRVGMQLHEHRRSSSHAMPQATPSRSHQPSGTQHIRGDERQYSTASFRPGRIRARPGWRGRRWRR